MISFIVLQLIRTLIIVHFYVGTEPGVVPSWFSFFPKICLRKKSKDLTTDEGRKLRLRMCWKGRPRPSRSLLRSEVAGFPEISQLPWDPSWPE